LPKELGNTQSLQPSRTFASAGIRRLRGDGGQPHVLSRGFCFWRWEFDNEFIRTSPAQVLPNELLLGERVTLEILNLLEKPGVFFLKSSNFRFEVLDVRSLLVIAGYPL